MGNTMGIDMGNTFSLFAVIAPLDQELLNTSSQAPRGTNDGVCDEVFSSSATSSKRIPGLTRAEKVLPMSVLKVLPMCVPRASFHRKVPTVRRVERLSPAHQKGVRPQRLQAG